MLLNKVWYLPVLLICLLVAACHPSELPVDKYGSWVMNAKHGMIQQTESGDFQFEALYQPAPFKAIQDLGMQASAAEYEKRMEALSPFHYFVFRIQAQGNVIKTGLSEPAEMEKRLNYFKHALQQDMFLVQGRDTMPCVLFHFEGTYDLSPQATFSLAFERSNSEESEDLQLFYYDQILGIDPVFMTFTRRSISRLPDLKL